MKIILSPNYQTYLSYIRENQLNKRDYRYIDQAEKLQGLVLAESDIIILDRHYLNPAYDFYFSLLLSTRIRK